LQLLRDHRPGGPLRVLSQADWIAGRLAGRFDASDESNALKLGYDPVARRWPAWLAGLELPPDALPRVHPVGTAVGGVTAAAARATGLPAGCRVATGATDAVAGFLAAGAAHPGEAVTSLGTTLALKLLSPVPVFAAEHGVYSHRLGEHFLAGGASNCGAGILARFFTPAALERLTPRLEPERDTGLGYYPLPCPGERFPRSDPALAPRLEPRPDDDARFLQGLLEGIAAVEAEGYRRLAELGAPPVGRVRTVGGGAGNPAWTRIRARYLGVPVAPAEETDAAVGAAYLARAAL
ncbi:FGGY-family carbohydrate kinase, partial [Halorhodospira neutriphila]|uniref:FGGY-family carbohydrate kinase n=1 Tax=Halorhodospira neutriphila TaxID=168379 RepID=UPI001904559A